VRTGGGLLGASGAAFGCAWSPCSNMYAVSSQDGEASVWDVRTHRQLVSFRAHQVISRQTHHRDALWRLTLARGPSGASMHARPGPCAASSLPRRRWTCSSSPRCGRREGGGPYWSAAADGVCVCDGGTAPWACECGRPAHDGGLPGAVPAPGCRRCRRAARRERHRLCARRVASLCRCAAAVAVRAWSQSLTTAARATGTQATMRRYAIDGRARRLFPSTNNLV
jgi:hypothetical protein